MSYTGFIQPSLDYFVLNMARYGQRPENALKRANGKLGFVAIKAAHAIIRPR